MGNKFNNSLINAQADDSEKVLMKSLGLQEQLPCYAKQVDE